MITKNPVKLTGFFYKEIYKMGKRLYSYDEKFFEIIDNEEKSYWLGFIMADGCITKNKLIISLSEKDKSHLEKFKESIQSTHPIKTYKCQSGYSNVNKNRSILQIIDEKIVNDLQFHERIFRWRRICLCSKQ